MSKKEHLESLESLESLYDKVCVTNLWNESFPSSMYTTTILNKMRASATNKFERPHDDLLKIG